MNINVHGNFNISQSDTIAIAKISLGIFSIFHDVGIDFDEDFELEFDNTLDSPDFHHKNNNKLTLIRLAMSSTSYWCQFIFQFSHELMHYAIYCHNPNDDCSAFWIEESVCEAMSLYVLHQMSLIQNWQKIGLRTDYYSSISNYEQQELSKFGNNKLAFAKTYSDLMQIELLSMDVRDNRRNEMQCLYRMGLNKERIQALLCYKDFVIKNKRLLDVDAYIGMFPNIPQIVYLCGLQKQCTEEY